MNFIFKTISSIFVCLFLIVSVALAKDKTTTVDGIDATIKTQKGNTVVILNVKHGKNRDKRRVQAEKAAKQATGCKARAVKGTVFDFQGKSEFPTFVQVKLFC